MIDFFLTSASSKKIHETEQGIIKHWTIWIWTQGSRTSGWPCPGVAMTVAGVPRCCELGSRWCRAGYTRSSSCTIARGLKGSLCQEVCVCIYIHCMISFSWALVSLHVILSWFWQDYTATVAPAWLKMYFFHSCCLCKTNGKTARLPRTTGTACEGPLSLGRICRSYSRSFTCRSKVSCCDGWHSVWEWWHLDIECSTVLQ